MVLRGFPLGLDCSTFRAVSLVLLRSIPRLRQPLSSTRQLWPNKLYLVFYNTLVSYIWPIIEPWLYWMSHSITISIWLLCYGTWLVLCWAHYRFFTSNSLLSSHYDNPSELALLSYIKPHSSIGPSCENVPNILHFRQSLYDAYFENI